MQRNEKINYESVIVTYPWIVERDLKCVISPDADGILSGLLMSHYLNWSIVGYYDNGKNLILKDDVRSEDCVFLDTEIHRPNIRSIGHHIVLYRRDNTEINLDNFRNCLNPNNLRGRTLRENFGLKYPMATVHLLLCIVGTKYPLQFFDDAFFVILQADGTINRFLDRYSENLRDWLLYLGVGDEDNVLSKVVNKETSLMGLNAEYVDYVNRFVKGRKDKIPISERGNLIHSSFNPTRTSFSDSCIEIATNYLSFLSEQTGWRFVREKWTFNDFRLYEFIKRTVIPGVGTFNRAVNENFLSLAITKTDTMEYTLERPSAMP